MALGWKLEGKGQQEDLKQLNWKGKIEGERRQAMYYKSSKQGLDSMAVEYSLLLLGVEGHFTLSVICPCSL